MKWLLSVLFAFAAIPLHAEQVNVAAASDLNLAIQEIIQQFELETGHNVRLTLGSSGNFYAQISKGAPFDVFLSPLEQGAALLKNAGPAGKSFYEWLRSAPAKKIFEKHGFTIV